MSAPGSNNVLAMNGEAVSPSAKASLVNDFARTVDNFQIESPATGAVWVVFDDSGAWRTGWTSENSNLPATAIIGMGVRALCNLRND